MDEVEGYIEYMKAKGYSEQTIKNRLNILKEFSSKYEIPDEKSVYSFIREHPAWNKNTSATVVAILRSYGKYIQKTKRIIFDLPESTKTSRNLPVYLTKAELGRLLNACVDVRDYALIYMLVKTGMRVSEIASLKVSDVDFENKRIRVRGKGDKERFIPFDTKLEKVLKKYILWRNSRHPAGDFLFISRRSGGKLSRQVIDVIIKKNARNAHLKKRISAHKLRHTFATLLLSEGANLRAIQELLGHRNISTTMIYTHVTEQALIDAIKRINII